MKLDNNTPNPKSENANNEKIRKITRKKQTKKHGSNDISLGFTDAVIALKC